MTDEIQDDDLIGQVMAQDDEERISSSEGPKLVEDIVSVLDEIGTAHGRFCDVVLFTNKYGQVYCLTCGNNVGSVTDISDAFCPKCGCANSAHMNGKCLMQGCPCSDAHEFRSTSVDTQTKEAKKWLEEQKAKHQRRQRKQSAATRT